MARDSQLGWAWDSRQASPERERRSSSGRRSFRTTCRQCGGELWLERRKGKWWPVNHDWGRCKSVERAARPPKPKRPIMTKGRHREFYAGSVPPWDASLGDFTCFEGCCGGGGRISGDLPAMRELFPL